MEFAGLELSGRLGRWRTVSLDYSRPAAKQAEVTMKREPGSASNRRLNPPAHAYTILLLSLLAMWVFVPFLLAANLKEIVEALFVTIALVAASYAMSDQGKSFVIVIVLGVVLALTMWFDLATATETKLRLVSGFAGLLFFGVVAYELLLDILSKESGVDMNLINGAIVVYLLIVMS